MSFCYLSVAFQCPCTSSFYRIASSHCPGRVHISQRTLCHIRYPHNMSCVPWASESLFQRYEWAWQKWSLAQWLQPLLFYCLKNVFTTWSQSLQSQLAQIKLQASSFPFLTCLVPPTDTTSAVCKSRHWHIYLHISSYMQGLGFWKIVRHLNTLPSGIIRSFLLGWTSIRDSHWEDNWVYGSFRHFWKILLCTCLYLGVP